MPPDMPGMESSESGNPLLQWLSGHGYMLHKGCFLYDNGWVVAYVTANWVISLAYALVSVLIFQRMRRARHIPVTLMGIALLGIFVTCSFGHFLAGFTTVVWPGYRLETLWHWWTAVPAWVFLANHKKFSLIVEGPHEIAETREELAKRNLELKQAYEKIKQLDELKTQFFANVSHELRTPLTLILGLNRRLQQDPSCSVAHQADLKVMERNAQILLKHVNDLLDLARLEANRMTTRYAEIDLARLMQITASNFEALASERRIRLETQTPPTLIMQADREKVERILINLISNAIKFTPDGGNILCSLTFTDQTAVLTVQDSGPGVPPELRELIFERFRQADSGSSRRYGGTGLGLAIVKDFVTLHQGSIHVGASPEGGAQFTVALPLTAPEGIAVESGAEADEEPDSPLDLATEDLREAQRNALYSTMTDSKDAVRSSPSDHPLILVVEDNLEMSQFISQTLSSQYQTVTAQNGATGLALARETRPDLILCDVMMPGRSGDMLVQDLRMLPEFDAVPIVMLTAKADEDLRIRLLQAGAQDYIMKPFSTEELCARVGNLISIKQAREMLQTELETRTHDLSTLSQEVVARKQDLEQTNTRLAQSIREAHHRIKNNLQAVTALLELQFDGQEGRLSEADIQKSLIQIKTIAIVHDLLSKDTPIQDVDVAAVLKRIIDLLSFSLQTSARPWQVLLKAEPIVLSTKAATALALIVNELLHNAVKHGPDFPAAQEALVANDVIRIELQAHDGQVTLAFEDTGPGFPANFDPVLQANIGLELVQSLTAGDLQGQITFFNVPSGRADGGLRGRVEVIFPDHIEDD